jgi:leader peptidase (prepilin peptidase)/N-methyltransferase
LSAKNSWDASGSFVRTGIVFIAASSALSVVVLDVPIASGLAVLLLIPAMLVDLNERRIPDRWVALAGVSLAVALGLSTAFGEDIPASNIVFGAAAMALPILFLHLLSPGAMGFGDVKAAIVLGAALGVVNWQLALVGLTLAAGIGATIGTMRRSRTIAFGPYLLIGTLVALAADSVFLAAALTGGGR